MNTTTTRQDVHKPSAIVPTDYTFIDSYQLFVSAGGLDCQDGPEGYEDVGVLQNVGPWFSPPPFGDPMRCDVCGTAHRAGGVFSHDPSGELVKMGRDCANKYSLVANWTRLDAGKKRCADMRASARLRLKAKGELRGFVAATPPAVLRALKGDHYIIRDIRGKVISYARRGYNARPLSEKQTALVLKLDRDEREKAARPAEVHVDAPVSDGRQTVEGTVVSVKVFQGDFGDSLKMTVKVSTPDGSWLCWGTCPSSLSVGYGLRGAVVRFDCALKPGRDAYFALFSRPTKAAIVDAGVSGREHLARLQAQLAEPGGVGSWRDKTTAEAEALGMLCPEVSS